MAKLKAGSTMGGHRIVVSPSNEDIIPAVDLKYNLGSEDLSWKECWVDSVNVAGNSLHMWSGSSVTSFKWQNGVLKTILPDHKNTYATYSLEFSNTSSDTDVITIGGSDFYAFTDPSSKTGSVSVSYITFGTESVHQYDSIGLAGGTFVASTGSQLESYDATPFSSSRKNWIQFNTGSTFSDYPKAAENFRDAVNHWLGVSGSQVISTGFKISASLDTAPANHARVKLISTETGSYFNQQVNRLRNVGVYETMSLYPDQYFYTYLTASSWTDGTDNFVGRGRTFAVGSDKQTSAQNLRDSVNEYYGVSSSVFPITASYGGINAAGKAVVNLTIQEYGSVYNNYRVIPKNSSGKIKTNPSSTTNTNFYFSGGSDNISSTSFKIENSAGKPILTSDDENGLVIGKENINNRWWKFTKDGRIQFSQTGSNEVTEFDFREQKIKVAKRPTSKAADNLVETLLGHSFGSGSAHNTVPLSLFKSDNVVAPCLQLENNFDGTNNNADTYIYFKGNSGNIPWSMGNWGDDASFRISNHGFLGSTTQDKMIFHAGSGDVEIKNADLIAPNVTASGDLYVGENIYLSSSTGAIYSANETGSLTFASRGAIFTDNMSGWAPLRANQLGSGPIIEFYSSSVQVGTVDNKGTISSNPGTIIDMTSLSPTTVASKTLSTSWERIHSTDGYTVFDVPFTGNVIVEFSGYMDTTYNQTGYVYLRLTDKAGTSEGAEYERLVDNADESDDQYINHKWVITGLTPGASKTYFIEAKTNSAGNGQKTFKWGGQFSGDKQDLIITTTTAPSNIRQ